MQTVIYHSADFDGIFCREVAHKFLGDEGVEYIGWDFGDKPLEIPSEGTIYVMDLPVDRVFGVDLVGADMRSGPHWLSRTVWIDHHKTSVESHPRDIPGYRIDGVAACRLAWQWFAEYAEVVHGRTSGELPPKDWFVDRKVTEPTAIRLAGEYDVCDKRDPDADVLQFGLRSKKLDDWDWAALLGTDIPPQLRGTGIDYTEGQLVLSGLLQNGHIIKGYQRGIDAATMKRTAHHRKRWGLNFLVANLAIGNPQTFDSAVTPETDALLMWRHDGEKVHVSLYGVPRRKDLDLSPIAKNHGGGGHPQACGFTIGLSDFISTILYSGEMPTT